MVDPTLCLALCAGLAAGLLTNRGRLARTKRRLAASERARVEAVRRSLADSLTGLPNRAAIYAAMDEAARAAQPYTVMFVDLDRFKPTNDTYGHTVGDRVLVTVADRLRKVVGGDGLVGRLGGDEFVVVAPSPRAEVSETMGRAVALSVGAPITIDGLDIAVGASVGVVHAPTGSPRGELLRAAEAMMYQAKRYGTGVVLHDGDLIGGEPDSPQERPAVRLRDLAPLLLRDGGMTPDKPIGAGV